MKRSFTKILVPLMLVALAYSLLFQLLYNWMRYNTPWPYPTMGRFLESFVLNLFPILILVMVIWLIVFRAATKFSLAVKISIDIVLSGLFLIFMNFGFHMVTGLQVEWGGSVFNVVFILLGEEGCYIWSRYRYSLLRESQYREKVMLQRYDILRMQINPHFLFNSLNILNSLIAIDAGKSREFVASLSKMYRYIMSNRGAETITLKEEVVFMNNYLYILQMRYLDKLRVEIAGEGPSQDVEVVAYTLQLLLENIIKHNVISTAHPMTVKVTIGESSLTVENAIRRRPSEGGSRLGLRYLTEMYAKHGKKFVYTDDGGIFKVEVPYL